VLARALLQRGLRARGTELKQVFRGLKTSLIAIGLLCAHSLGAASCTPAILHFLTVPAGSKRHGGWRQALPGYVPSVVTPKKPLLGLPAAFTRLLRDSGQPLYGWLAKSADRQAARFSGLQGPDSPPIHFILNHLRGSSRKKSPLETGLSLIAHRQTSRTTSGL